MNPDAIRLEKLRQQVQASEFLGSYAYGYLDRGNPNEEQQREAEESIQTYQQWRAEGLQQLRALLAALRATAPDAIEEWARWHMSICERVIGAAGQGGPDADVRLYEARQTLDEWRKVLDGEQDYVSISDYFLSDYNEEVAAAVTAADPE
jgi:hypothetical protein